MIDAKNTDPITSWWSTKKVDLIFWFLTSWTLVQFGICMAQFVHVDAFMVPASMPFAYFLLILIYVLRKEVDRWLRKNRKKRMGEFFLIGWWFALLVMYLLEFKTHGFYQVPGRMLETCIWIMVPYGISKFSIILHAYVKPFNVDNNHSQ